MLSVWATAIRLGGMDAPLSRANFVLMSCPLGRFFALYPVRRRLRMLWL